MADPKIKWSAPLVRKQFLEFFEKKGHTIGMWRGSCSQDAFFPVWDCTAAAESKSRLALIMLSYLRFLGISS
jgi:hypothetical protein